MNAVLWTSETENMDFSLYKNYFMALKTYFGENIFKVDSVDKLDGIKNMFIIDEHFKFHNEILMNEDFIKKINLENVNVIVFNMEKIYNSFWRHNLLIQKNLSKINNLVQILSDVQDIKKMGTPFNNIQYLSREINESTVNSSKKNEILFYGQLDGSAYKQRRKILNNISKFVDIPVKIKKSDRSLSYEKYLELISEYKFILNPLGAGKFLNIRYFETLQVKSIPIQQYTEDMVPYYSELKKNISINFINLRELKSINFLQVEKTPFKYYLENYFNDIELSKLLVK